MNGNVVISGAGPNGLKIACELGLAGLRPLVLDRLPGPSDQPKANGLLGQVVQQVDRRGLYEQLGGSQEAPKPAPYFMFAAMGLDLSLLKDNPIYTLPVPQPRLVRVLAERATELGTEIRWGHEVVGLSQDDDAVTLDVHGPEGVYRLQADYLVGADGAHSVTRKSSGIDFPGVSYERTTRRSAHVTVPEQWCDPATGGLNVPGYGHVPPFLGHRTEHGGFSYAPFPGHPPLVATTEWDQPEQDTPMSLEELRESARRVLGVEVPFGPPEGAGPDVLRRLSGGNNRVAERFRDGRVFLVGDAAHVDAAGGQGSTSACRTRSTSAGNSPHRYTAPRPRDYWTPTIPNAAARPSASTPTPRRCPRYSRPVATSRRCASCSPNCSAMPAPCSGSPSLPRAATSATRWAATPHTRWSAKSAPDMELRTATGPVRLAELTRTARPLLLDLTEDGVLAGKLGEWHDGIDVVIARPQTNEPTATALLLRPDCYVAWASASAQPGPAELDDLAAATERWFGKATAGAAQLV